MIENNYKHGESMKLDDEAIADYLRDNIIPGFLPLLNQQVYSVIFNRYHEFVICTNLSANSIGFVDWQTAQGLSIKDHSNDEKIRKVFGALYTPEFARLIHRYAEDVCELQNQVFIPCQSNGGIPDFSLHSFCIKGQILKAKYFAIVGGGRLLKSPEHCFNPHQ